MQYGHFGFVLNVVEVNDGIPTPVREWEAACGHTTEFTWAVAIGWLDVYIDATGQLGFNVFLGGGGFRSHGAIVPP